MTGKGKKFDFQRYRKRQRASWRPLFRMFFYLIGLGIIILLIVRKLREMFPDLKILTH